MTLLKWREYKYFPYEREFARLEVLGMTGVEPIEYPDGLLMPEGDIAPDVADRLTYFAHVIHRDGTVTVPRQARLEMTAAQGLSRQSTRYSAHGLHEYKGKFNPQVVRAIGNILGLEPGSSVLDPFCGSGTTLIECAYAGWESIGLDINPLAVLITNAKIRAIKMDCDQLRTVSLEITDSLSKYTHMLCETREYSLDELDQLLGFDWMKQLPSPEYLDSWFPIPVLAQVVLVLREITKRLPQLEDQAVFQIILSNLLRDSSWQEPADLRVRRRKEALSNYPLLEDFQCAVRELIPQILEARKVLQPEGTQLAILGDIRSAELDKLSALHSGSFDAVITSPPYATALPYIDTQRLSLVLLGLVPAESVRKTERDLIGAREIRISERRQLEARLKSGHHSLPSSIERFCRELLVAAEGAENGFRRKSKPALILRYFLDMNRSFQNLKAHLRPGAKVALVIGTNKTTLGGNEFVINTPKMLTDLAYRIGFEVLEVRTMDTYPRYDLHQKNSINEEKLVVLMA